MILTNLFTGIFILFDYILSYFSIEGRYYINHFISNSIIIYNTIYCVSNSYMFLCDNNMFLCDSNTNCNDNNINLSKNIIYALHFYHILWYFNKLRFDDWLHHIIMILIVLPISYFTECPNLIGHSFFFLIGLPGGIDYVLLFLVRNNIINKITEKKINRELNLWIRCPGCIASSVLIYININQNIYNTATIICSYIIMIAIYWNGIYFMNQTVSNYAVEIYKK